MTREEAAHIVDVAFHVPLAARMIGEDRTYQENEIREAKDMAIQALTQEPICPSHGVDCEDCPAYEPSDDPTNGDVVKTLFSNTLDNFCERTTWEWNRWWNAPYKAERNE